MPQRKVLNLSQMQVDRGNTILLNLVRNKLKPERMFVSQIQIRVRYGETDQMGYVYYGNYASYFEVGRVEALRKLGYSYKGLEDDGIMLPVFSYNVVFLKPSYYDDDLPTVPPMPSMPWHDGTVHYVQHSWQVPMP